MAYKNKMTMGAAGVDGNKQLHRYASP